MLRIIRMLPWIPLALFPGPSVLAQPEYQLHIISPLGGGSLSEAYAYDINNANQAVGYTTGTNHGFLWAPGTGTTAMPFAAVAIADDGTVIIGSDRIEDLTGTLIHEVPGVSHYDQPHGYTLLATNQLLGGPVMLGRAVDTALSNGGCPSSNFSCINPAAHTAFIWDPVNGIQDLDVLGVPDSFVALDINGAGLIVGETNGSDNINNTMAFVFDYLTHSYTNLGTLRPDNAGHSSAQGVNEAGQVAGWATAPGFGGDEHAFLWDAVNGLQDLGTLGPDWIIDQSKATDINEAGVVVGNSSSPNTVHPLAIRHAFVWDAVNGMRDLNDLVVLPQNFELVNAIAINDAGWICGYSVGSAGNGFYSSFVLEPISAQPQPSFVRGDCNADGTTNLADAVTLLGQLFGSAVSSTCDDSCDANDDGMLNIADAVRMLAVLFQNAPPLAAPGPGCGVDPTPSALDCTGAGGCP